MADAEQDFSAEVAQRSAPVDHRGAVIESKRAPESLFSSRELEGDPITGDTRDGGDDDRLRAREREIADGRIDERAERSRRAAQNAQNLRRARDAAGSDDGTAIRDPEDLWADTADESGNLQIADQPAAEVEQDDAEGRSVEDAEGEGSGQERYEVTVDGATHQVTLNEALRGYVRQATFHQRMTHLNQVQQQLEEEFGRQQQNWNLLLKVKQEYEEDLANLIPREPNWDQEFARDPHGAHATQKIFQTLYAKLALSRQQRAQMEAHWTAENDRRVQKYAVDGFSKFVMDNKIPDEPTLNKELQSMRRTAADAGFSEYEAATVYDPRMLTVLRWASKFRRITAAVRPRAVVPGKGRTLAPGAATPLGNVRRPGFDDAQRQLARSGKIDDAAEVFRRLL